MDPQPQEFKPSFYLSVYRRPRLPGDHTRKPAFILHFYEVPAEASDSHLLMDRAGRKSRWVKQPEKG